MNSPGPTLGGRLRLERERQGLTVQKVADELRLDTAVIDAIEDDSYEGTVPPVYSRGHVRKYARLLGVPYDEGQQSPPASAADPAAQPSQARRHQPRAMRIAPRVGKLPWAQIGIVAAIILVLLLFWWSPWKHRVAVQAATSRVVPAAAVDDGPAASAATGELVNVTALVADGPTDLPGQGHISLRLSFTAASWIDVRDASGRALFVGLGQANTVKLVSGRAPLRVHIGYVGGVRVAVNDHEVPIGRAFVKGNVARFQAGADGLLHAVKT